MPIENIESIATSVGLGGITGFLLGYFIRKIIKLIFFAVGGILALLLYLQCLTEGNSLYNRIRNPRTNTDKMKICSL